MKTHDLESVMESRRLHRRDLVAAPMPEKLRMLDALVHRDLALRGHYKPPATPRGALRTEQSRKSR